MLTHEEAHRELAALEARIHRAMGQKGAIGEFNHRARAHARLDHPTHYPSDYRPLEANMTEVIIKATTKRTPKATKPKAQPHPCECGCGEQTITGRARFIPGHDAKLASQLVRSVLEGDRTAEQRLKKLGWTTKLEAARRVRAKKANGKTA
jgi:hypothetical protein